MRMQLISQITRQGVDIPDAAMTLAAVDRLVHHATIFEMNVESYRRKAAEMAKGSGLRQQKTSPAEITTD